MKKILGWFIFCLLLTLDAHSATCKVEGISDSPQRLHCLFYHSIPLDLTCKNNHYFLKWKGRSFVVESAYHLDVENGPSPLVFKGKSLQLIVTGRKGILEFKDQVYQGNCR